MAINLQPGDRVIVVVPEKAQNPGETDDVVVYIETVGGWLRVETIPPENQSDEMKSIFSAGAAICQELKATALRQLVREAVSR